MVAANRLDADNGDRCLRFAGAGCRYYVLLCDGMGTGPAAVQEGKAAASLLRELLLAGFPAEYALRSLNSLSILRNFGGCATVDLLLLQLDTGKGTLYKWGAAASYLMKAGQYRKIGTAGPPPGLSQSCRETVDRLSLSRGELLILLSDGVCEEGLLNSARTTLSLLPGELAAAILEQEIPGGDDATAVVVRLATT
jgi:stage II sporulation protein E